MSWAVWKTTGAAASCWTTGRRAVASWSWDMKCSAICHSHCASRTRNRRRSSTKVFSTPVIVVHFCFVSWKSSDQQSLVLRRWIFTLRSKDIPLPFKLCQPPSRLSYLAHLAAENRPLGYMFLFYFLFIFKWFLSYQSFHNLPDRFLPNF